MGKAIYTYDDFMKKATGAGLWESMSAADKALAEKNPNAGMSILQYRLDYSNAATDEAKALAHQGAERIRKQYGGYLGGDSGSDYYLDEAAPARHVYEAAPAYESPYGDQLKNALSAVLKRDDYQSAYGRQIEDTLAKVTQGEPFSYDTALDPLFQSYAKAYRREGDRAAANALGNAATLTGGIPSSYAMTAANQAGDYYATQLSDKAPELAEAAYRRYLDQQSQNQNALKSLMELDNAAYQKYIDALGFDHDDLTTLLALDESDYQRFKNELAQYNIDRDFDYGQWLDDLYYKNDQSEIARNQQNYEKDLASSQQNAAADTTQTAYENELTRALYAAEYLGDYSLLRKLLSRY